MRQRIIICLGLLLALCLTGDVIALLSLNHSLQRISELAEAHRIQTLRSSLDSHATRLERDFLVHLWEGGGDSAQLQAGFWKFQNSLAQCRSCHHAPAVAAELQGLQKTFDDWLEESGALLRGEEFLDGALEGRPDLFALAHRVPALTSTIVDRAHLQLKTKSDDASATIHSAWVTLCSTLVLALIGAAVIAFHLHRRLTRPLSELLDLISVTDRRDAGKRLPISGDAEFRRLGEAIHQSDVELKRAQDGVLQAEKMAAVGQLAAGMAHEVGNPLASISSVVQIMRQRAGSEKEAEQLDLIMRHIDRISRIVRGFLGFSRSPGEEQRVLVEVPSLLAHAAELVAYDKRSRNVTISQEFEPHLPAVWGDADRLSLVFTNIIINALDALEQRESGDGRVVLAMAREGDSVVVRITDNGPGMSEEVLASAFTPLFTTKPPGVGTGLGLWICYEAVRGQGGGITLDSRLGEGTTVTIEFPVAEAVAAH
jgi:signal transduction histidine kinase